MQHLRSSTSSNLIDSPLDDQGEEVNAETSSPDTQETSEVISPDNTVDPVAEENKVDDTVEDQNNTEDTDQTVDQGETSQETGQTEDQEDSFQEADQTVDQENTSQETNQTEYQEETPQEPEQEEETGESQTIIISMPEAPGDEPVTYEYITVSPSSNDIAVDFTETNTYLSIICVLLLFFTIVCICRYIYKFFSMFF